jgi:hypothetical protein
MGLVKTDFVWDGVHGGSLIYIVQHIYPIVVIISDSYSIWVISDYRYIRFIPVHTLWTAMQDSAV